MQLLTGTNKLTQVPDCFSDEDRLMVSSSIQIMESASLSTLKNALVRNLDFAVADEMQAREFGMQRCACKRQRVNPMP